MYSKEISKKLAVKKRKESRARKYGKRQRIIAKKEEKGRTRKSA